jgi:hypothetical protein
MLEDTLRNIYNLPPKSASTAVPMMGMESMTPIMMQEGGAIPKKETLLEQAPRIANNVIESLRQKSGSQFDEAELDAEIIQQLRPISGSVITNEEVKIIKDAVTNKFSLPVGPPSDTAVRMQEGGDPMMEMMGDIPLDAEEQQTLQQLIQTGEQKQEAPLFEQAQMLAAEGTGEDTVLAHLRPGEVVLPPEFMQDAEFESQVEAKFNEFNLDPATAMVGSGIATLNPMTGLEEFGIFKKIGKSLKKVVKKIAPVAGPLANFIPGVGPVLAAGIGAATNVAAGKGLKGAISGALGGYGTGKLMGGIGSLGGAGAQAGTTGGGGISSLFGRAKEFILPGQDKVGLFGNIGKMFTGQQPSVQDIYAGADPSTQVRIDRLLSQGASEAEILQNLGQSGMIPQAGGGLGSLFGGTPGQSRLGLIEDLLKGRPSDPVRQGGLGQIFSGAGGAGGAGGMGGGFGLGDVGAFGLAGLLGKMAYEEAKKAKGVPLTPLVTMGPTGRYNIEAEIARRMGQQAPNPVEFGLLPEGTIPQLSGGMAYGGPVQAFADGGAVAMMNQGGEMEVEIDMDDFDRMNGDINGPGTETSDEIPAMLSDGEFVMTGRAVRGAGSYELQKGENGIISLIPSFEEDRERGTQLMYQIMDMFAETARAS